jgi:hypothetical protein
MSDASRSASGDDDVDAPVEPLQDFALADDERFVDRVGRRIERRLLSNELLTVAWHAPLATALELLRVPFAWKDAARRPSAPPTDRS